MKKNTLETVLDRTEIIGGCRVWKGHISRFGYGEVKYHGKKWKVHRLIWTLINGPIEEGLGLDHLCRNRACCEISHLEPVTQLENVRRGLVNQNKYKEFCINGHLLSGDNLYQFKNQRACKKCNRRRQREYRIRRNNEQLADRKR